MVHTTTVQYAGHNLQYIIYQLESVNATQHPFIVIQPGLYPQICYSLLVKKFVHKGGKGTKKTKSFRTPKLVSLATKVRSVKRLNNVRDWWSNGARQCFQLGLLKKDVDVGQCGVEDNPRLNPQETLSPRHLGLQIIRYSAPIFNSAYKHVVNMLQITRYSALIINTALSTYNIKVQIILFRFSFSLPQ